MTIDLRRLEHAVGGTFSLSYYSWYLLSSNLVIATMAAVGLALTLMWRTRRPGSWIVQAALFLDLLFNQFAAFHYSQFGALVGFAIELTLLLGIRLLLRLDRVPDFDRRLLVRLRSRAIQPSSYR